MKRNYENTLPKRNNGSDKAVKRRLKKIQDKAVKNGELTDSFFPFKKFVLTKQSKDSEEKALIYWEPTEEPLEAIAHLPANVLRENLPEFYKNCSDEEIYEIMEQKIERNSIIRKNLSK